MGRPARVAVAVCAGLGGVLSGVPSAPLGAQPIEIVPPAPGPDPDTGCQIKQIAGGFVAVRSGPGTGYPLVGALRPGDAAYLRASCAQGWCYVDGGVKDGQEAAFRGWVPGDACLFYP